MNLTQFKKLPILGIVRGIEPAVIKPLVETVIAARLGTLEITMNTPGAPALIREAIKTSNDRLTIGAGTVLTMDSLKSALDAGATFIVMPTVVSPIVRYCVENKIPVFPGALTPQEIYNAWDAGATMVKVFPAGFFGPAYFKEIKGPFQDIKLLACSGVTPDNLGAYFANGADAIAFGGSVFRKELLSARDFPAIGKSVKKYIDAYHSAVG